MQAYSDGVVTQEWFVDPVVGHYLGNPLWGYSLKVPGVIEYPLREIWDVINDPDRLVWYIDANGRKFGVPRSDACGVYLRTSDIKELLTGLAVQLREAGL